MKSPNMISRIGRWPRSAIPAATPKSDASLIGVVSTRSGYASLSPAVTLNAPPYGSSTSSPRRTTSSRSAKIACSVSLRTWTPRFCAVVLTPRLRGRRGRGVGRLDRLGETLLAPRLDRRALVVVQPRAATSSGSRVRRSSISAGSRWSSDFECGLKRYVLRTRKNGAPVSRIRPIARPAASWISSTSVVSSSSTSTPNAAPRAAIDPASSSSTGVDCA